MYDYAEICMKSVQVIFHARCANSSKMRSCWGYSSCMPSFEGNPLTQGTKFCHKKL